MEETIQTMREIAEMILDVLKKNKGDVRYEMMKIAETLKKDADELENEE